VVLSAPAKVNLTLEVTGRRADGYHEIATVFQCVDLCDRLVLEDAATLSLESTSPDVPVDERNLALRAAQLLREAARIDRGVHVRLDKRIPVGAGLGGGSSDAAAALLGLDRLWRLRWAPERLAEVAVQLGMDVPFFLGSGRAIGTGRGEQLERLPSGGGYALVLINPGFGLSTREVYGRVIPTVYSDGGRVPAMREALRRRNTRLVAANLYNGLEAVVGPADPIRRMKAALMSAGALGAAMSGSGPTVFGVARSLDHARQIRTRVTRGSWSCWSVRTLSGPAIRIREWTGSAGRAGTSG